MRILLVADLEDWILGQIARRMSSMLRPHAHVTLLFSQRPGFYRAFIRLQRSHDVVHFLSPWDFYELSAKVAIPCAVSLWHMVDWSVFDPYASRIDAVLVGSHQWETQVRQHVTAGTPVQRMQYGVDTALFARSKPGWGEANAKRHKLVLGFAAKFTPANESRKGVDRLWQCLSNLQQRLQREFVVQIVGPGWEAASIPASVRSVIQVLGEIAEADFPRFYSGLDYYLCTSRQEGVPYPVLEAMSCECVVLSTPVGVVPELITTGENGFILDDNRIAEQVADIVQRTADDVEFRSMCGRKARSSVAAYYSWDSAVDPQSYLAAYSEAIRFHRARPAISRYHEAALHLARLGKHRARELLRRGDDAARRV